MKRKTGGRHYVGIAPAEQVPEPDPEPETEDSTEPAEAGFSLPETLADVSPDEPEETGEE